MPRIFLSSTWVDAQQRSGLQRRQGHSKSMGTNATIQYSYAFHSDFNQYPNIYWQPGQPDPSPFACWSKCFLSLHDRTRCTSFNHLKSLVKTTADPSANLRAFDSPAQPRKFFRVQWGLDNDQNPDTELSCSQHPEKTQNPHETCSQHQIGISPLIKAQESHVLQGSIQNTESSGYEQKFTGIQVHKTLCLIDRENREQAAEDAWPHDTKLPRGWREAQVRRTQMLLLQLPMEGKK